jgi:imidazolonepropionase
MSKLLIKNISQIATPTGKTLKKGKDMENISLIEDGAIYIEDDIIKLVGKTKEVVSKIDLDGCQIIDGSGKCAVPGFVDSHTHFVFGGYRQDEFIKRLRGSSYMDIMKMGGGIMSSVNATRDTDFNTLYNEGKNRLNHIIKQGVTTIEGKSGYGLDFDCEIKQLDVMKKLQEDHDINIISTFLGAHAVPPQYKGKEDEYIDFIIKEVLPVVKEKDLAVFCDIFCEEGVFTVKQSRKLLLAAKGLGFDIKIHADEIVTLGGGELAAELGATSADHLLMVSDEGVKQLTEKNVVSTLLPCTAFCLNKPYAPARKLIDSGCGVALASDLNPGSCFSYSIPLIFAVSAIHMKMTVEEVLTGITLNGAAALNLADKIGSIEIGKKADINLLEYPDYKFLVYHTGTQIIDKVIKGGKVVYGYDT